MQESQNANQQNYLEFSFLVKVLTKHVQNSFSENKKASSSDSKRQLITQREIIKTIDLFICVEISAFDATCKIFTDLKL